MSVLLYDGNTFHINGALEPMEFWPYTTNVVNPILEIQRLDIVEKIGDKLVRWFKEAGIEASIDNKIVFGLRDLDDKMWYIGFKDGSMRLGVGIRGDHTKPITRNDVDPSKWGGFTGTPTI